MVPNIDDYNAEQIIDAIYQKGTEPIDEVVDYALCRNDIVKYTKSTYIV